MRSEKISLDEIRNTFLFVCLFVCLFYCTIICTPLVTSEVDLNLLNLAENEGEKSNPPFDKLVDFLKDWAIEVASENDRSLASFGPAAQKSDGREGCYKSYIWINHDMYESCVMNVK